MCIDIFKSIFFFQEKENWQETPCSHLSNTGLYSGPHVLQRPPLAMSFPSQWGVYRVKVQGKPVLPLLLTRLPRTPKFLLPGAAWTSAPGIYFSKSEAALGSRREVDRAWTYRLGCPVDVCEAWTSWDWAKGGKRSREWPVGQGPRC